MKQLTALVLAVLMLGAAVPALANQWGTKGNLTVILNASDDFDAYSATEESQCILSKTEEIAVLHKDYKGVRHNVLLLAVKNGKKWTLDVMSTTAVPQPTADGPDGLHVILEKDGSGGFTLMNPAYEPAEGKKTWRQTHTDAFHFTRLEEDWVLDHLLLQTDGGQVQAQWTDEGYRYTSEAEDEETLWSTEPITLETFNISLIPGSGAEAAHLTALNDLLPQGPSAAVYTDFAKVKSKGTAPVYSAPDKASWRSAEGKAAVGLKGSFCAYAMDGEWALIEYESSLKTHRVGYMQRSILGKKADQLPQVQVGEGMPLQTARETWLTDDPLSSQYRQFTLPEGTPLTVFSRFNPYYAYVETRVEGQRIRGFVPLADVAVNAEK